MNVRIKSHIIEYMFSMFIGVADFNMIAKYGSIMHRISKHKKTAFFVDLNDVKIAIKYIINNNHNSIKDNNFYELCYIYYSHKKKDTDFFIVFDNDGGAAKISNIKALRNLNRENIITNNIKRSSYGECSDELRHCKSVIDMADETSVGPFTKKDAHDILAHINNMCNGIACHPKAYITTEKRTILYP